MSVPDGSLPVFSCDTEEEAESLLTHACPLNPLGEYIAPELAEEQTLENLAKFSVRLQGLSQRINPINTPEQL